jgi:hypothetical protein
MYLHINHAKLYLMVDDIEIHIKLPQSNVWNLFLHISILSGILYNILLDSIKNLNRKYI